MGCTASKEKKQPQKVTEPVEKAEEEQLVKEEKTSPVILTPVNVKEECLLDKLLMENSIYRYKMCNIGGEVQALFPPAGLCYIIAQNDNWFVYNDTLNYEFHLNYQFPQDADVTPGPRSTKELLQTKWISITAVVYPLETINFVSGKMEKHISDVFTKPLSDEYYERLSLLTSEAEIEIEQVLRLADGSLDEEEVLQKCIEAEKPFVDPSFLPSQAMLSRYRIDARNITPKELRRPKDISGVNVAEVDAIHGEVYPLFIDGGLLSDNWFLSAMAILAEGGSRVQNMFTASKPNEKRLGAYRILLNKNGWWRHVIIDDFLPTVNGVPCFARLKSDPSALWVSLLQKAYAKLHGSYASITGGDTLHALRDFSGAPTCRLDDTWENAAVYPDVADGLLNKLALSIESGDIVVLTTPTKTVVDNEKPANGLRDGYTYYVEAIRRFPEYNLTLLKIHNPWEPLNPWTGAWGANCNNWNLYEKVKTECALDCSPPRGNFWMEWSDAVKHFDGCGLVYKVQTSMCDYRVLGAFEHIRPSIVFMVHAVAPIEVMLILTQRDKRGMHVDSPDARFSPLMISVSHKAGDMQRVVKSSTLYAEGSTEAHTFVVAREVVMTYRFEPSDEPYFVIPRIHRKGIAEGQKKEFVFGIRSATPLDGVLDVRFTQLEATSPVFKNRLHFTVGETPEIISPLQKRLHEGQLVTDVGSKLSTAAVPLKQPSVDEPIKKEEYVVEEEKGGLSANDVAGRENLDVLPMREKGDAKELSCAAVASVDNKDNLSEKENVPEVGELKV